ncbi:MAG: prepilin-type N-terminal cleavage/methylation domain-containing protein [Pseudomonadota bacterium]|nr:prepilin-type N-terminal cleavage/methylation domain-containing protein [Pseudomonadota bacterium]
MHRKHGFTLIEVMITVAIVAILAAIALPSYSQYVQRGRITGAISNLSSMRVKMEQYFQDNRTYNNAAAPPCGLPGTSVAPLPTDPYFTFTCPVANATQFTILAQGIGTMAGFQYSIDQNNTHLTVAPSPPGWAGAGNTCWVIRPDGSC